MFAGSDQPFQSPLVRRCGAAEHWEDERIGRNSAVPMAFAIVSRSVALIPSPIPFIFPVSRAARIAVQGIWRSVSGNGAPTLFPGLWQVAQCV